MAVGPVRILSQAFRYLSGELNLSGTQHVGRVDLDAAIPTLDLTRFIPWEKVRWYRMAFTQTHAGAGIIRTTLRPWFLSDWAEVNQYQPQNRSITAITTQDELLGGTNAIRKDWVILDLGGWVNIPASFVRADWYVDGQWDVTTKERSLTNPLVRVASAGAGGAANDTLLPAVGDSHYFENMPYRLTLDSPRFDSEASAACQVVAMMNVLGAEPGTLPFLTHF